MRRLLKTPAKSPNKAASRRNSFGDESTDGSLPTLTDHLFEEVQARNRGPSRSPKELAAF
jgi:hypothetical protein